ncbi:hypothetical protein L6164_023570 [Bauhinia variegata]|uniref:Uncharacterized protein n=1 Tax=Bauhinia variegata TaxID=167791 RepID=A0ACB9MK05_BAUVA|nr:hypothetical protein L6164_023570 [Bauhinia variegata]
MCNIRIAERRAQLQLQREERSGEIQSESDLPTTEISKAAKLLILPPVRSFQRSHSSNEKTTGSKECVICFEELKNGDLIQHLPKCNHEFHASCINSWLQIGKFTCPVCRFVLRDLLVIELMNCE